MHKQMAQEGVKFDQGRALTVKLRFGLPIPKSDSQRSRNAKLEGSVNHTQKPDIDNLVKFYLDCANEVAWHDDCQITRLEAEKFYSDNPSTEMWIHPRSKRCRKKITPQIEQLTFYSLWGV